MCAYIELGMFLLLVQGKWTGSSNWNTIVDPLNGEPFIKVADVSEKEILVIPFECYVNLPPCCFVCQHIFPSHVVVEGVYSS